MITVGTVVARNYLPFARVLAASLRRHHPELSLVVLVTDGPAAGDGVAGAEVVPLHALALPEEATLVSRSTVLELAAATKPFLLGHLLDRGADRAVFLDPDVLVLGDLEPILSTRAAISLTPHLLRPAGADRELAILRAGVFNAGYVGVNDGAEARRFLAWWQDRVHDRCRFDAGAGLVGDQKWLDLAPSYFPDLHVVDDPGCNVAYWNLHERALRVDGDRVDADNGPCRFFHFSGFDPRLPDQVTRHQPELRVGDTGAAAVLFRRYADLWSGATGTAPSRPSPTPAPPPLTGRR